MSMFVLVHGSWHGAWCWSRVVALLEAAGHQALAIDLPGHGDDPAPPADVTLDDYARRIAETVAKQRERVVLVGHSMGGGAITQAVESCASNVGLLVYLAGFVPRDGMSIADMALCDPGSLLTPSVRIDSAKGVASLDDAAVDDCFYADCSAADRSMARARLRDDPLAPLTTPLSLGDPVADAVPRAYIECLRDRTVSLAHQREMQSHREWVRVVALDTSHSPFLSAPESLVDALLATAEILD